MPLRGRWDKEPGQSSRQWRLCRERGWPEESGEGERGDRGEGAQGRRCRSGLLSLTGRGW